MLIKCVKISLIILSMLSIEACSFTSSEIAMIGARTEVVNIPLSQASPLFSVETDIYQSDNSAHDPFLSSIYDYSGYSSFKGGVISTKTLNFSLDDIEWTTPSEGKFKIFSGNDIKEYSVTRDNETLHVQREYKEWFSYPSQTLLLITVPIDLVLSVAAIPAGFVYIGPLVLAYSN